MQLRSLRRRKQRNESEDDTVDEYRIERVQRPQRHRERIGIAMRPKQVREQPHPDDTQHVAGQHSGNNRQAAAHQWAFRGSRKYAFRADRRR